MAINWVTAFKVIPWADVVSAAPAVVKGAKKLWSSVKTSEAEPAEPPPQAEHSEAAADTSPSEALAALEARLRQLDRRVGTLGKEAVASSELIRSLAEQNAQLVAAVEALRLRTRTLLLWCLIMSVSLLALAAYLWVR